MQPAGFGCPCHGGAYDTEGNRTAGPPVRSLDRFAVLDRRRPPRARQALQRRHGRGHGRRRADHAVPPRLPGRPRRRLGALALPDPGAGVAADDGQVHAQAADRSRPRSTRSTGSRSAPASSAASSGSSSATSRATSTGCRRSARRRSPRSSCRRSPASSSRCTTSRIPTTPTSRSRHITNDVTLGWLVRGMHKWGASVFIILMFLHMAPHVPVRRLQVPARAQLDHRRAAARDRAWREGFTGYLLPWDQTAYWATVVGINLNATAPFAGPVHRPVPPGRSPDRAGHARRSSTRSTCS